MKQNTQTATLYCIQVSHRSQTIKILSSEIRCSNNNSKPQNPSKCIPFLNVGSDKSAMSSRGHNHCPLNAQLNKIYSSSTSALHSRSLDQNRLIYLNFENLLFFFLLPMKFDFLQGPFINNLSILCCLSDFIFLHGFFRKRIHCGIGYNVFISFKHKDTKAFKFFIWKLHICIE